MDTTHQGTTLDTILHHRQKLTKNPQLSTSSPNCPLKTDTQQQPHTESFFPIFLIFSFSGTTSLQVLRKPDSCQTQLNPTMYQRRSPSRSWGNQTPVNLNWTLQCPKVKALMCPEGPDSHHPGLNPKMYQSWKPSGSQDQTPVSLGWTPQWTP